MGHLTDTTDWESFQISRMGYLADDTFTNQDSHKGITYHNTEEPTSSLDQLKLAAH